MQPTVDTLLALLTAQRGDRYVFGAEVAFSDPNPARWDCSELVEWACRRAGVQPVVPDGAAAQWRHCLSHKAVLANHSPAQAPRGALLFRISPDGRAGGNNHVAVALGRDRTIEARGTAYGVNEYPISGRFWTGVALVPGVDYHPVPRRSAGAWFHRLLALGAEGPDVAHVQHRVGTRVDGDYGPKTRAAVMAWQRRHRDATGHQLAADGVVGLKTATVLG